MSMTREQGRSVRVRQAQFPMGDLGHRPSKLRFRAGNKGYGNISACEQVSMTGDVHGNNKVRASESGQHAASAFVTRQDGT